MYKNGSLSVWETEKSWGSQVRQVGWVGGDCHTVLGKNSLAKKEV
jgi:hypothetical protein